MALAATGIIEVRTTGSDLNGGGFNSALGGTDYSLQDAAQATGTVTSSGTTVTATTGIFTSAMVGNYITDGTTWKEITAFTSSLIVTVDSAPSWTAVSIKVGGALATPAAALALLTVHGLTAYVKSTGTYSISAGLAFPSPSGGNPYDGKIRLAGYSVTRGDEGKATIQASSGSFTMLTLGQSGAIAENLIIDGNNQTTIKGVDNLGTYNGLYNVKVLNCTNTGVDTNSSTGYLEKVEVTGCSSAPAVIIGGTYPHQLLGCNIHDNTVTGVSATGTSGVAAHVLNDCEITNNTGASSDGVSCDYAVSLISCTVSGNGRDGFRSTVSPPGLLGLVRNNIFAYNGGYGINLTTSVGGTQIWSTFGNNAFLTNTSGPRNNNSAQAGDVTLSADPFTNKSGGDFSLNNTAGGGASCRAAGYPGVFPGAATTGYLDIGAVQHADPAGGGSGGGSVFGGIGGVIQ